MNIRALFPIYGYGLQFKFQKQYAIKNEINVFATVNNLQMHVLIKVRYWFLGELGNFDDDSGDNLGHDENVNPVAADPNGPSPKRLRPDQFVRAAALSLGNQRAAAVNSRLEKIEEKLDKILVHVFFWINMFTLYSTLFMMMW